MANKKVKNVRSTRKVRDYGKLSTEEFCKELKKWQQDPGFVRRMNEFVRKCLD